MEKFTIESELRDVSGKLSLLRADKKMPAVVYGHKFVPQAVTIGYSEFLKVFRKSGKIHIITLTLDEKKHDTLIHDIQKDPVTGDFLHADFFVVSATEKIHVQIPLALTGESLAQKQGGVIEQNMHAVEVKCLAKDLVDAFEVDLSRLAEIGDVIHIQDIGIDTKKFDILSSLEGAVVSVHALKKVEEEVVVPVVAATEVPSVQEEKKMEKEEKKAE